METEGNSSVIMAEDQLQSIQVLDSDGVELTVVDGDQTLALLIPNAVDMEGSVEVQHRISSEPVPANGTSDEKEEQKSYVRVVNSMEQMTDLLRHYQEVTQCKFVTSKRSKLFGISPDEYIAVGNLSSVILNWSSRQTKDAEFSLNYGLPSVPYCGIPFVQVGTLILECHMGRVPKYRPRKSQSSSAKDDCMDGNPEGDQAGAADSASEDFDEQPTEDSPQKDEKPLLPDGWQRKKFSGKVGCPATIAIKQVAFFTDFKVQDQEGSKESVHRKTSKAFREKASSSPELIDIQMKYYVRVPHISVHKGHEVSLQPPVYKCPQHSRDVLQRAFSFTETGHLADMRFNIESSNDHLKLHSVILAASSQQWKSGIFLNDYSSLVECLGLLSATSMRAFIRFMYTGELVADPKCDFEALSHAFKMAGVPDGAKLCQQHLKSVKRSADMGEWDQDFHYQDIRTVSVGTQTDLLIQVDGAMSSNSKSKHKLKNESEPSEDYSVSITALTNVLFPSKPVWTDKEIENKLRTGQTPKDILKEFLISRVSALEEQLKKQPAVKRARISPSKLPEVKPPQNLASDANSVPLTPSSCDLTIAPSASQAIPPSPQPLRLVIPPGTLDDKVIVMAQNVLQSLQQTGVIPGSASSFKLMECSEEQGQTGTLPNGAQYMMEVVHEENQFLPEASSEHQNYDVVTVKAEDVIE